MRDANHRVASQDHAQQVRAVLIDRQLWLITHYIALPMEEVNVISEAGSY